MRRFLNREFLLICVAGMLLWLPMLGLLTGSESAPKSENRAPAPRPASLDLFTRQGRNAWEAWWKDHFAFRNEMTETAQLFRFFILNTSPSDQVLPGRNKRFFYLGDGLRRDYQKRTPFTKDEKEKWESFFQNMETVCAQRGMHYYLLVAPDTATLYPECLPGWLHHKKQQSRLDELVSLHAQGNYKRAILVDVRDALLQRKKQYDICDHTGTHWSQSGAFFAIRHLLDIMDAASGCSRICSQHQESAFTRTRQIIPGLELAGMMGLRKYMKEEVLRWTPGNGTWAFRSEGEDLERQWQENSNEVNPIANRRDRVTLLNNAPSDQTVLVFRDSYGRAALPYLSRLFKRVRYLQFKDYNIYLGPVKQEHPEILLQILGERLLLNRVPEVCEGFPDIRP